MEVLCHGCVVIALRFSFPVFSASETPNISCPIGLLGEDHFVNAVHGIPDTYNCNHYVCICVVTFEITLSKIELYAKVCSAL